MRNSGTPHRRTTHPHVGSTHNRTSPLSRVDGIDRLECSRPAQDIPPTQTAAKNRCTTDYLTPHPENRPSGTALDIVVRGHLKHEDQMACGGWTGLHWKRYHWAVSEVPRVSLRPELIQSKERKARVDIFTLERCTRQGIVRGISRGGRVSE